MSSPGNSGPGTSPPITASPRLSQRTIKLNPVSAPGFKPVAPHSGPVHRVDPPLRKQSSLSSLIRRETKLQTQPTNSVRSGIDAAGQTSSLIRRDKGKPEKLTFLTNSDKNSGPPYSSSVPILPSPTSPRSPQGEFGTFSSRSQKTGALSRNELTRPELLSDKQYPIQDHNNVLEFGGDDYNAGQRARNSIKGDRMQIPSVCESRSPSPMSRRKQMAGNTLSPVPGSCSSGLDSALEKKRVPRSKSPSISPVNVEENPLPTPQLSSEIPQKNLASLGIKSGMSNKTNDDNLSFQRCRSKGAATPATSLTAGTNSNARSSNRIDINFSTASPLSPRKRQPVTGDTTDSHEAFQENYRFFLRDNYDTSKIGDHQSNTNKERIKRMFSPAPVRDIFSPMPSTPNTEDFLDDGTEISLPKVSVKEGKRASSTGLSFPAIRVENVDDSGEQKSDLNDDVGQGSGGIAIGRRSRSVTPSSGSSTSTSPSPTSPPPMEFSRFKPTRARSTNTLLTAEASKVIDSWLSPTLSPTPPAGSNPSSRYHPDDARLSWRRSGSSSTSCLLNVPPPLIKRQTSEGRLIVGVPDALTIPGEGGAEKKGMKSRGWSRSESNLFVRTGRPVGRADEGDLCSELEDCEDSSNKSTRSFLNKQPLTNILQKSVPKEEDTTQGSIVSYESSLHLKSPDRREKVVCQPLTPPSTQEPKVAESDLPVLSPRPPSKPRPSYRNT